jgi:hypothetical protein
VNFIEQIVTALLKWLTSFVQAPPTVEDAKSDPDLKKKLLDRIAKSNR